MIIHGFVLFGLAGRWRSVAEVRLGEPPVSYGISTFSGRTDYLDDLI